MSIFSKKFKELLEASPEHQALKERVTKLEAEVASMGSALNQVLKSYVDMARVTMDNRRSLEEVLAYLTDPLPELGDGQQQEASPEMTPEQLAAYKRNLN